MLGRRLLARLLDAGLPLLILLAGPVPLTRWTALEREGAEIVAGLVAVWLYWLYETVLTARAGQTVGKRLAAIRVVTAQDAPPDLRRSATRALPILSLALPVLWVVAPLAYSWAAFSPERRGLHDLAAGTRVVGERWIRGDPEG